MKILKVLIVTAILLTAAQAHAISTLYNIYFTDTRSRDPEHPALYPPWSYLVGPAEFQGTYTLTDGILTQFSAVVGVCQRVESCLWNNLAYTDLEGYHADPESTDPFVQGLIGPAAPSSRFVYYPVNHTWNNGSNPGETIGANNDRTGIYRTQVAPEVSPIWLILTGLALIAVSRCRFL